MSAVIVPAFAAMPAATAVPAFATMPAATVPAFATVPTATAVPAPTPSMTTLAAMFSRGRTSHCDGQRHDDEQP